MAGAAVEDGIGPKDPVEGGRGAEALGKGMGLYESAVKNVGREHIQDGRKRPWNGAAFGRGMGDVRHEMADRVILRELAYKSWKSEAGRQGGKMDIEGEHMSKDCQ